MGVYDDIKEDIYPALITGAISSAGFYFLSGSQLPISLPLFGALDLPAPVTVGVVGAASHLAGNVLENQVLPLLDQPKGWATTKEAWLNLFFPVLVCMV